MAINYAALDETFRRYPMCVGSLAEELKVEGTKETRAAKHAVCAVGAMLLDVGAVESAEELVDAGTDEMIDEHFAKLRARYGFRTKSQVRAYVDCNDDSLDDDPDAALPAEVREAVREAQAAEIATQDRLRQKFDVEMRGKPWSTRVERQHEAYREMTKAGQKVYQRVLRKHGLTMKGVETLRAEGESAAVRRRLLKKVARAAERACTAKAATASPEAAGAPAVETPVAV
jgi:hypothetical protein